MAERIEYQGDALPSGLPGFGGATVSVLTLPGFNRVVAPQKFGPAVDAPEVTPPDPTPPPGNTPSNPTNEVITPPTPPGPPGDPSKNFCKQCEGQDEVGQYPILTAKRVDLGPCRDCSGKLKQTVLRYLSEPAAETPTQGLFWGRGTGQGSDTLTSLNDGGVWSIGDGADSEVGGISFVANAEDYTLGINKKGVTLTHEPGEQHLYEPKEIKICIDGETKTWLVLAYQKE